MSDFSVAFFARVRTCAFFCTVGFRVLSKMEITEIGRKGTKKSDICKTLPAKSAKNLLVSRAMYSLISGNRVVLHKIR